MDLLPEIASTFWKAGRLKTFEHWPFQSLDDTCNPERMAAAGFAAIGGSGEPDLAECFICGKQLDGWESNDDPWGEHVKHQPQCPFIKLDKRDESLWTVRDLFDLFKKYCIKECIQDLDKAKMRIKEESTKMAMEIPQVYKTLRRSRREVG
ncbi:hypothetical protein KM043_012366 [Ampulex compressa]|nr:hypothetical protein KM043_012366 [Ampulex compressa]